MCGLKQWNNDFKVDAAYKTQFGTNSDSLVV